MWWMPMTKRMNHCLIARSGAKPTRRTIPPGGFQPIPSGLVVLPGVMEWPEAEIDLALHHAASMIPHATVVLGPVLASTERRGQDNIRERIDFRPVTSKYAASVFARDGAFILEPCSIFVSLSATTSPSSIIIHEIWHYAECCLLTDDEIVDLAVTYGVMAKMFAEIEQPIEQNPCEWLACAFVHWFRLHNHTGMVVMQEPLDTIFHQLASGGMAGRKPRKAQVEIEELYHEIERADGVEAIELALRRHRREAAESFVPSGRSPDPNRSSDPGAAGAGITASRVLTSKLRRF